MPDLLIDRLLNEATPLTALTGVVPLTAPPPALLRIATLTLELSPVTMLPSESSTSTCTVGLIDTPAVALVGSPAAANTTCDALPGVMLNVLEVAAVSVGSVALSV